jgi:iron(III) transport system permease protein
MRREQPAPWIAREGGGFVALLALVVVLLGLLPASRLIVAALAPGWAFNPQSALAEITSRSALTASWHTLETAVLSSAGALLVGGVFALTLATTDVRGKRVLAFLFVLSLLIAPQVAAIAFKSIAGPASPLLQAVALAPAPGSPNIMLGRDGIIFVLSLHHAPLVAITLAAGLRAIPRSLIEAAHLDGATPPRIVRLVILPLLRPHLVAAALLAFVAAVGNFGIAALLGLPHNYMTLPTLIYRRLSSFGPSILPDVAALSILVGLIAGAGVLLGALVLRRAPAPLEPEEAIAPFWRTGPWRWCVEGGLWLLIALAVLLPLASLLATSLVPAYGVPLALHTVTLDNFAEVLLRQEVTKRAFRTSLLLSSTAAMITAVLAVLIAYTLERYARRGRVLAESLLEIPYALPGVVLAIACILLFLRPLPLLGVSIYATPFIILFAYLARFQALALKAPLAAMSVLARDQEEAAALDRAGAWQRLRFLIVPQLLPAATAGGLLVFLVALNELTVSALLWTAGTETLGVALLSLEEAGLAPQAAALAIVAALMVLCIMLTLDRLGPWLPDHVLPWMAVGASPLPAPTTRDLPLELAAPPP